jgi:hypothetical protein
MDFYRIAEPRAVIDEAGLTAPVFARQRRRHQRSAFAAIGGQSSPQQPPYRQESVMVLCPVAIAAGCRKCPIVAACPLKSVIGDYKKEDDAPARPAGGTAKGGAKKK